MSKTRKSKSSKSAKHTPLDGRKIWPAMVWVLLAGAWFILFAALWSYNPADPPSHAAVMAPDPATGREVVQNWVGRFGAVVSYRALRMLGPGVWVGMTLGLLALATTAARRPVTQPVLRVIGAVLMVVAASAVSDLYGSQRVDPMAGGLVAFAINTELLPRFAVMGTVAILLVGFLVGMMLAIDQIVVAVGAFALRAVASLTRIKLPSLRPALAGITVGSAGGWGDSSSKSKSARKGKRRDDLDHIDEDAGGIGATESFIPEDKAVAVADPEEEEQADDADAPEDIDEEDDDAADAPGAFVAERSFDPESLRAKIKQLPINFAAAAKKDDGAFAAAREIDLSGYQFPGLDQLEDPEHSFSAEMEALVREQAVQLESALRQYRIEGEVVGIDSGPVITLFEVRLAPGTKVNAIARIASDLARALKAQNVRIVSNTAGKDTVGIEVPNLKKEKVRLKELMTAQPDSVQKMKLPMFLGKDASGQPLIYDLTTMPHMLIAGTTGSGKSVCMNSIIMSFLFTKRPDELKLVLVDPKMVEMSMFKDVPHLMCPVVTEMSKAAAILEWATTKMDERYELLAEAGVRDVAGYNALTPEELRERFNPASEAEEARIPKKLPYLVFIIDELADLIMTHKDVEGFIVRLAQKARAVGLHLILATQRPQANVVTGLIKGNMPCRVSFKVASGLDSRIVLDQKGAELLLGQGDMLFLSPRTSKLSRAQGTLVEDSEIRKVVKFLKNIAEQNFEPQLVQLRGSGGDEDGDGTPSEKDPLFEQAVDIVMETRRGSVSLLQRRLAVGYSRASRLIEQMAEYQILGSYKGSQAREVVISPEEWDAMKQQARADAEAAAASTATESSGDEDDTPGGGGEDEGVPDEIDDEYRQ
ncbi:MAG: DNA translocase FtsK 4TM domain-containing protein [Phycisphaeraceae bacterium]|nr:DNA translocase FtsK 4TM domain-containing protein [Phycisphaeraceae bacterium]